MEIQNKGDKKNLFNLLIKTIKKNFFLKVFVALCLFIGFALFFIYVGAKLNKNMNDTGQKDMLKAFYRRVIDSDFTFISKYSKSQFIELDDFKIDVKFKDWEKIRYLREKAVQSDSLFLTKDLQEKVPARIHYNNKTYKVSIGLTGYMYSHFRHPYKWSLSVQVKKGQTIKGMKKFALLFPEARGYLTDWIATKLLIDNNVIGLRSDFVNVTVNGKNQGTYYLEERYDKRLIENNGFREGIVFKILDNGIKVYGQKKVFENQELSEQLIQLKQLLHQFLNEEIAVENVFDLKKMATIFVVSDIMNQVHSLFRTNMRFYFNPVTKLIEPIGREWGYLRKLDQTETEISIERPKKIYNKALHKDFVLKKMIDSYEFKEEYIKKAVVLTNAEYLDSILSYKSTELEILLQKVYKEYPFYIFPKEILFQNQIYIKNRIFPKSKMIDVFYSGRIDDSIHLKIQNKIDLPIKVHYFTYDKKDTIFPSKRMIVMSNYISKFPEKFIIGHTSRYEKNEFSIEKLEIIYSVLGTDKIKKTIIFKDEESTTNLSSFKFAKQVPNFNQFNFLKVDKLKKVIEFNSDYCEINKDLIIPKGYILSAKAGVQIDLIDSARIISYSPVLFFGKKDSSISITSSDSTGQGMVVFNADRISEFSFVDFTHLSNISSYGWNLRGAITFYESPVNISNCSFSRNLRGDDYLNIIRTEFNIQKSRFLNTHADAFDSDYCTGTIAESEFVNIGNDAIDVSGTKMYMNDIVIIQPEDKGISGGEGSNIIGVNILIEGGEIAIASKDNSNIDLDGMEVKSSRLAFCAFQKKSEFGPGVINATNTTILDTQTDHLIEIGSSLLINGEFITEKSDQVKQMLYGKEYGKSSKR